MLNGKLRLFPISEDCLILNIYSPAEATTGTRRPVCSTEGPVCTACSAWPVLSPALFSHCFRGPKNTLG